MEITITVNTEGKTEEKLKALKTPSSPARERLDPRTTEMLGLLKKRLDRQSEPIGGSI